MLFYDFDSVKTHKEITSISFSYHSYPKNENLLGAKVIDRKPSFHVRDKYIVALDFLNIFGYHTYKYILNYTKYITYEYVSVINKSIGT